MTHVHICILEADRPAEEFQPTHGTYGTMFEDWLGKALPQARFTHVHVAGNDPLPDPEAFDGYLVTGSRSGVYDAHDWIGGLGPFLRQLRDRGIPVAGVCFGHQIMAEAFGGRVEKSSRGWIVGHQVHQPTQVGQALFGGAPLHALSFHQDQIVTPPSGARVTLANSASPYGGLAYGFPALSVQFHPEFSPAYVRDLLDKAAGVRVPEAVARTALSDLETPLDADRVASAFADFFATHIGP